MEMQEALVQIEAQKFMFDSVNAEKIAIDQMLLEALQSNIKVRKELLLVSKKIQELTAEIDILKSEKTGLQKQLDEMKTKFDESQAQLQPVTIDIEAPIVQLHQV